MKKVVSIAVFVCLLTITIISHGLAAKTIEKPTWRTANEWQYNMTIEGIPATQRYTIYWVGWGEFYDNEGTEHKSFEVRYITNIIEKSGENDRKYTRTVDARYITRSDFKLGKSLETTRIFYKENPENRTITTIINYDPFVDFYSFPIIVGDRWNQTSELKIERAVYRGPDIKEENLIENSTEAQIRSYYFHCTGEEEINVTIADNPEYDEENVTSNWTKNTFKTLRIVQDDEEKDTDGTYTVEYWNTTVGNIVKRETFIDGNLNSTSSLVYYQYKITDEPYEPKDLVFEEQPSELCLCIAAIALLVILIIAFIIIRRRQLEEEDRFTREYIEDIDTKAELIELCEEAGLSPKGSKGELRRRLLSYAMEKEEEEEGLEEGEEIPDEEDEFDLGEDEEEDLERELEDEEGEEDSKGDQEEKLKEEGEKEQ